MIDPAILLSLEKAMPPQTPAPAIMETWVSPAGAVARRVADRLASDYEAHAGAWLSRLDELQVQLQHVEFPPASEGDLAMLDGRIGDVEAHADLRALHSARVAKRIRRDVKKMFALDPSAGAAAREMGNRLIATDKRVVEGLLDFALILRAVRAHGSGEARGGPVFDDTEALAKHLDGLAA